jgi:hypothetical protein
MSQVAAVGEFVCKHWKKAMAEEVGNTTNPPVAEKFPDQDLVRDVLLVHDLGNIVKFSRPFLGELEAEADHWARVQDDFRERYGEKATVATVAMLEELHARPILAEIIQDMSPLESGEIPFIHLETQICSFADMSVTPRGIEGFEARMLDLTERYPTDRVRLAMQEERANAQFVQDRVARDIFTLPYTELEARAVELLNEEIRL